jgi:ABC-type branched-subunit amino acid transport system ATPase component
MSNDIILSVKGISKTFGGLKALVDVGFDIQRGEVYGIIGPNGSGKTSLINCITGFIQGTEHYRLASSQNCAHRY